MPRYKTTDVCKPCWELKYCPYGTLVEEMPFPISATKMHAAGLSRIELYARAKAELRAASDRDDDDRLWQAIQFIQFADPAKMEYLDDYRPEEIGCSIFGHTCPVFFYGSLGVTETKASRKIGRYVPRDIMLKVVRRDDYICQDCGERVKDDEIEFDHIIPHAKSGPLSVENIRLLYRPCNRKKSDSLSQLLDS